MSFDENTTEAELLPLEEIQNTLGTLSAYLHDARNGSHVASLELAEMPEVFRGFAADLLSFCEQIEQNRELAFKLMQGTPALADIDTLQNEQERKQGQQEALHTHHAEHLLEGITKSLEEWIVVIDRSSYEWLYTNHNATAYLPNIESEYELKELVNHKIDAYNAAAKKEVRQEPLQATIELMGMDGSLSQYFSLTGYPLSWMDHDALVVMLVDVTSEYKERKQLEQVAYYDELTKVYSRHYGMQLLERWVEENQAFVISFIDLDGLKYVNDTFGHKEGDKYILATAEKLSSISNNAVLCRLGGDEFMIMMRYMSASMVRLMLEDIRTELLNEFNGSYERSFSYGVVDVNKDDRRSASLLLSIADESMYEDKRNRKKERRAEV